jgi:hypothetical protein
MGCDMIVQRKPDQSLLHCESKPKQKPIIQKPKKKREGLPYGLYSINMIKPPFNPSYTSKTQRKTKENCLPTFLITVMYHKSL